MGQDSDISSATPTPQTRLMVFMFTDIAGSTHLKQLENLGAAAYAVLSHKHDCKFR
jgi:hypothetical protein